MVDLKSTIMNAFGLKREHCLDCDKLLTDKVAKYSISNYKILLCLKCQDKFKIDIIDATEKEVKLYIALKCRGVKAELQKNDGYKTVDIVVEDAKVNIEVDGRQHSTRSSQALTDLKRTYHSLRDGYLTLRIPNALIHSNLDEAAEYICKFLEESKKDLTWDNKYSNKRKAG